MAEAFRTCPTTGLKVHLPAENLIKANAVAAVVFLAVGGLFGLLVALTRWPAVHLLPADWFYLALTAHGLDVLLVWIIFFEMAVLYFASAVLLNCRLATPRIAWVGFAMMLAGAVMVNVAVLQGQSTVMFTSYVPMKAAPHFYLGLLLFAVGALIGSFVFFGTLDHRARGAHLSGLHSARHVRRVDRREPCRTLSSEELAALAPNMRSGVDCVRARVPVTVELEIDGERVYYAALTPSGLANDGPSSVYERFEVPAGRHRVQVRLRDSRRERGFDYERSVEIGLEPRQSFVIDFRVERGGFQFL